MDTQLVEKIVHEVKSQGVFDEFRKDSIADVDTKPAYQNLRQRVENAVKKFLAEQQWTPETNKNQLREKLRRHITESGFLDVGVERIVDQVVNPKIGSVFQPRIEEIAYKYLGLPPPPKMFDPPPPPLMHPLPPLPLNAPPLKVDTCSLLPTDLEQVSPDSDKGTVKSEGRDDRTIVDMETDEKITEDEDESPPFEPIVKQEHEDCKDGKLVKMENIGDIVSIKEESDICMEDKKPKQEETNYGLIKTEIITNHNTNSQELSNFDMDSAAVDKETSQSVDARIFQDSQLSSVSSDSHLSVNGKEDSLQSSSQEAVSANISEEAQMPKFNENSCEPYNMNGKSTIKSELHFDIKKDEIKFEGTERKTVLETPLNAGLKPEDEQYSAMENNPVEKNKHDAFKFTSTNSNMDAKYEELGNTPNAQELSFGSSIDDSSSIPMTQTPKSMGLPKEQEESPQIQTPKQLTPTITQITPTTTPISTPSIATPTATPSPITSHRADKEQQSRHSSSSSSKHKKHSKERRRSYEREKDKDSSRDRHRSSKDAKDSFKNHSSGSGTKNSIRSSSSSSIKSSSHHKSTSEKDIEKYSSSSTHSSSKHIKHSNSHSSSSSYENQDNKKPKRDSDKRHHSSSSNTHREHSSSSSSKRNDRKDDHSEAKHKALRRKSYDSNDDDGDKSFGGGGGNKSTSQYKLTSNSKSSKYKSSSSDTNKSPSSKSNGTQRADINHQEHNSGDVNQKIHYANNVVILNDILENPQTQFIQLNNTGHMVETPTQNPEVHEFNNNLKQLPSKVEENEKCSLNTLTDLLYFEEMHSILNERLKLLNNTMDLCRNAVNSLRFDSLSDEGIELSNEEDANNDHKSNFLMETLKRKADFSYEDYEKTPRKRIASNESEGCQVKTSPAPSDSSFNSKENEEIPKNTNHLNKSLMDRHKAVQKLNQQQRYSSEDLYKPRPILGQRSRRRGMDSII